MWSDLLEQYPEDAKQISDLRVKCEKLGEISDFAESPAGQFFIEFLKMNVDMVNNNLLSDEPMSEMQRGILLEKRRMYNSFVGFFTTARQRKEQNEKFAASHIKNN